MNDLDERLAALNAEKRQRDQADTERHHSEHADLTKLFHQFEHSEDARRQGWRVDRGARNEVEFTRNGGPVGRWRRSEPKPGFIFEFHRGVRAPETAKTYDEMMNHMAQLIDEDYEPEPQRQRGWGRPTR